MTWQWLAVRVLLVSGVGVEALCCLGLLAMRSTFDRIHFLGPATILGASCIAGAVLVSEWLSPAGINAILIWLILLAASPLITHVIGRAAYLRRYGHLHIPSMIVAPADSASGLRDEGRRRPPLPSEPDEP